MRLMVEFTTEPFELDTFPPHAVAARKVVDEAGLDVAVGPFGTGAEGEADRILEAVSKLLRESLDAGATRISVQVSVLAEAEAEPEAAAAAEAGNESAAGEGGTP
nr:thiamine-binding protein [Kitasatospora purpeofusca]